MSICFKCGTDGWYCVTKGKIRFSWLEVPGTGRRPSSVRILSGIFVSEAISGRQDRDFDPSWGSRQLPIIKTATGVDSW